MSAAPDRPADAEVRPNNLDHLVLAVPDLRVAVDGFADRTGVRPLAGGRHLGYGTANYLVGLGAGAYLEIIGPDPDLVEPPRRTAFGIGSITAPTLLTWAVRIFGMDDVVDRLRERGYDPGDPAGMSRRTTDGTLLAWSLTPDTVAVSGGLVPFLIDWGTSPHPTTNGLPQVELLALTARSPRPSEIAEQLVLIGAQLPVAYGVTSKLCATIRTPRGDLLLGPDLLV